MKGAIFTSLEKDLGTLEHQDDGAEAGAAAYRQNQPHGARNLEMIRTNLRGIFQFSVNRCTRIVRAV